MLPMRSTNVFRGGVIIFHLTEKAMNGLIYLVGLIVIIMFILSFLGLH